MKPQFLTWLCIAGGGGLGAVGRYVFGGWVQSKAPADFPLGTLLVNVLGCFAFGLLYGWLGAGASPLLRGFLFTGMWGGFTTFSTFGFETFQLLQRGHQGIALAYVASSLLCGIGAAWVGLTVGTAGHSAGSP